MSQPLLSRRDLLRTSLALGAATTGILVAGCSKESKKELACADTTGLAESDVALRKQLAYVDHSSDPAKNCGGCKLFKPAAEGQCGGCSLLKGPIHPAGYCVSWASKTA